jgi:hypothetical protein
MVEMRKKSFGDSLKKQMKLLEGKQRYVVNGLKFPQILTLIFITLKLLGKIAWSWWWVLSPMWLPVVVILGLFVGIPIIAVVCIFIFFAASEGIEWLIKKGRG